MAQRPPRRPAHPPRPPAESLPDAVQQAWATGVEALAKAQQQGGKVLGSWVEDGVALQRQAQARGQAQVAEAADHLAALSQGLGAPAAAPWERLEGLFEQRVAKAMARLDIARQTELDALRARVESLETELQALRDPAGAGSPRKTATSAGRGKAPDAAARSSTSPARPARRSAGAAGTAGAPTPRPRKVAR